MERARSCRRVLLDLALSCVRQWRARVPFVIDPRRNDNMLESPVAALLYGIAAMVVCAAIAGATYGVGAAIMVVVACVVSGVAVAYATFLQADSEAEEDNEDEE